MLGHDAAAIEAGDRAGPTSAGSSTRTPRPDVAARSGSASRRSMRARGLDAAFALLGDQPLVDPAVLRALARGRDSRRDRLRGAALRRRRRREPGPRPRGRLGAGSRRRPGTAGSGRSWPPHPELVAEVELGGATRTSTRRPTSPSSPGRTASGANRDQVDRHREVPDGPDFYGPVTGLFRADPAPDRRARSSKRSWRSPEPGDTWLDIGAGAGRYALPLALRVARGRRRRAVRGDARRPRRAPGGARHRRTSGSSPIAGRRRRTDRPPGSARDVALIAHLGYDIEAIGPFLDAMEAATTRLCVAVLMERQPSSIADPFWPPIHGEERVALPALPGARRRCCGPAGRAPGGAVRAPAARVRDARRAPRLRPPPALARRGRPEGSTPRRARPGAGHRARRPLDAGEPADVDRARRPGRPGRPAGLVAAFRWCR